MNELGVLYHNGRGVEQDFKKAISWYDKAVDEGNKDAWINIGVLYYFGQGVDTNHNHATTMFLKAENEWSMKNVIFLYKGKGTDPDLRGAVAYFKKAAELGDAGAMYNLGLLFETRIMNEEKDHKEAASWYKKAADLGNTDAMYRLGVVYDRTNDEGSKEEAASWYKKAADLGNTDAMVMVGTNLHRENKHETISWLKKAADLGNTDAMVALGVYGPMLTPEPGHYGEDEEPPNWLVPRGSWGVASYTYHRRGTEQSYKEAISWFRKAADMGNTWAMLNLSTMYLNGFGVERDCREAMSLIKKAMNLGNLSDVQSLFGQVRNDYRKVRLSNDWETMIWMGLIEFDDQGTEQSYKDTMAWFKKAADVGGISAMNNIGILYECGLGVKQDYKEAASWYRKAAELGNVSAMLNTHLMYSNGWGVEQDHNEAMSWFRKALHTGTTRY